jgi:hypothetical protein
MNARSGTTVGIGVDGGGGRPLSSWSSFQRQNSVERRVSNST